MNILASPADLLGTPWGMAIFIVIDIAVLVLIIALNYRWLFKRVLDFLFAAVFLIVFFPFFLIALVADAIYNRVTNAYKSLFAGEYCVGKKEKVFRLFTFTTERVLHDEEGRLLPVRERITPMGRLLSAVGMKYYPCLVAVLAGKMSFVGPRPLSLADAAALTSEQKGRFAVRPGLVSSLERYGGESLTYPEMFEEDAEYEAHIGLFKDISFFMTKLAHRLRGDSVRPYGECTDRDYIGWMLDTGAIGEEEAAEYRERGEERLAGLRNADRERRSFERNLFQ